MGRTPDDDRTAALADLQRETKALSHHLQAAMTAAAGSEGADRSGRVIAVLDANGRVESVRLSRDWRRAMRTDGLAAAIVTACSDAGRRYVANWAGEIANPPVDTSSSESVAGDASPRHPHEYGGPPTLEPELTLRELWSTVHEASSQLGRLIAEMSQRAGAAVTGHDSAGRVTAVLEAEEFSSVTLDQRWLAKAGAPEIGGLVTEAIQAAYAVRDRLIRESSGTWPLSILLELASFTAVGAPPAAAGSVLSTLKVITLLLALVTGATTYMMMLYTSANDLNKRLHNSNGFPQDGWPTPRADLSDGRIHPDGTLDWHVKT